MKRENMENALTGVKDMYIQEAAQTGEGKKHTRLRKKWIVIPVAAAMMAGMMLTVNAIAPVDLGFYLKAAYGDSYAMLDEMTAMPDNVAYRSSGEEITLELKGIMGDSQTVVAFVDVTVAADVSLPEHYTLDMKLEPTGLPWEKGLSSYGSAWGDLDRRANPDGSTTFSCKMTIRSRDGVMASKYAVKCSGIRVREENAETETMLLEGEWNLAFGLNYKDLTQVIAADTSGELMSCSQMLLPEEITEADLVSVPAQVYEVRMSPLSLGVYWMVDTEHKNLAMENSPLGCTVTLRDGTVITKEQDILYDAVHGLIKLEQDGTWRPAGEEEKTAVSITGRNEGGRAEGHEAPYYGHCILTFDAELPVDEVESVTIGGLVVPLG